MSGANLKLLAACTGTDRTAEFMARNRCGFRRIRHGPAFMMNADAAHSPRLADFLWRVEKCGAEIALPSCMRVGIEPAMLRHDCHVVTRKPR